LSLGRLFAHVADYWLGYWLIVRPLLVRSGLVIFDRYFNDLLVDPKRYRYGGPLWMARLLTPLTPTPDLLFVLDSPAEVILGRKQEVAPAEVQRQRRTYLNEAKKLLHARVIDSSGPALEVGLQTAQAVADYLDHRFQRRYARWLALAEQR
jgi:thymidylate kinase